MQYTIDHYQETKKGNHQLSSLPLKQLEEFYQHCLTRQDEKDEYLSEYAVKTCEGILKAMQCLTDQNLAFFLNDLSRIQWEFNSYGISLPGNVFWLLSFHKGEAADLLSFLVNTHLLNNLIKPDTLATTMKQLMYYVGFPIYMYFPVVLERLKNLVEFLQSCRVQLGMQWQLSPSGSDGHRKNQQVVWLCPPGGGQRSLFKPRSMKPDYAFNQILLALNRALERAYKKNLNGWPNKLKALDIHVIPTLPALHISLTPTGGVEDEVIKYPDMDNTQAKQYFFQMGMLVFALQLAGMDDAHQDNIIPTEQGPVLIDAECLFSPSVLGSQNISSNGVYDAFAREEAPGGGKASAVFQIETVGQSTQVYQEYAMQILNGFTYMQEVVADSTSQDELVQYLLKNWFEMDQIRTVPLATMDFSEMYLAYANDLFCDKTAKTSASPKLMHFDKLVQNVLERNNGGYQRMDLENHLDKALKISLERGDVPYFFFCKDGNRWFLQLDDTPLLQSHPFGSDVKLGELLAEHVAWLLDKDALIQLSKLLEPGTKKI